MKIIFKTVELDIDLFENVIWLILKATLGRLMVTFGFRAVSEQFQSSFRAFSEHFQSNFRLHFSSYFQCCNSLLSWSGFGAVLVQFQSNPRQLLSTYCSIS